MSIGVLVLNFGEPDRRLVERYSRAAEAARWQFAIDYGLILRGWVALMRGDPAATVGGLEPTLKRCRPVGERLLIGFSLSLLGSASGPLAAPAQAGDAAAAPAKVRTLCQNCHGENGVAVLPGAANLSGQQKEYLTAQLRAFRSGSRQNPQMSVVAKTLSDADIDELAGWYSGIKVSVKMPK